MPPAGTNLQVRPYACKRSPGRPSAKANVGADLVGPKGACHERNDERDRRRLLQWRLRRFVRLRHHLRVLTRAVALAIALIFSAQPGRGAQDAPPPPRLDPQAETLLYDHPSGRTRIFTAMRWKAEN